MERSWIWEEKKEGKQKKKNDETEEMRWPEIRYERKKDGISAERKRGKQRETDRGEGTEK